VISISSEKHCFVEGGNMNNDANIWRFLVAVVYDQQFRNVLASQNSAQIQHALQQHGIQLGANEAQFIAVCNQNSVQGTWNVFEQMRGLLLGIGGGPN
jgi:hypothetical protein